MIQEVFDVYIQMSSLLINGWLSVRGGCLTGSNFYRRVDFWCNGRRESRITPVHWIQDLQSSVIHTRRSEGLSLHIRGRGKKEIRRTDPLPLSISLMEHVSLPSVYNSYVSMGLSEAQRGRPDTAHFTFIW